MSAADDDARPASYAYGMSYPGSDGERVRPHVLNEQFVPPLLDGVLEKVEERGLKALSEACAVLWDDADRIWALLEEAGSPAKWMCSPPEDGYYEPSYSRRIAAMREALALTDDLRRSAKVIQQAAGRVYEPIEYAAASVQRTS